MPGEVNTPFAVRSRGQDLRGDFALALARGSLKLRPVTMTDPAVATAQSARLDFVDNLRWVMIVLVVSMHAAVTYSHLGSWYFMEDPKPGLGATVVFAAYQMYLQAFFMGLLFLIAGYFVPPAFDRKGFWRFLRDRAIRLGVPSLVFMLVIHPVTVYWLLQRAGEQPRPTLLQAYWPYLSSGRFLSGSGPMWFTVALLLFSAVYGVLRVVANKDSPMRSEAALPRHREVLGLAAIMALFTFLVRTVQPIGTNVMNMQLCFFSQYVLLFAIGLRAVRRNWLLRIPYGFGMRWLVLALSLGTLAWLGLVAAVVATHTESALSGGWTWQSAWLSIWESFFCVGVCLGLVVWFRERFNQLGRWTGRLTDNSFSVYLFHTPVLIAVTLGLHRVEAPKLVKFLMATVLGVAASYAASALVFRRIPLLKRVL